MSNPLTIITAATTTGPKSDAPRGGEREGKAGFAFEDALNEELELNESENSLTALAQQTEMTDQPDVEIIDPTEAPEDPQTETDEWVVENPDTGLLQSSASLNNKTPVAEDKAGSTASPQFVQRANQTVSPNRLDQGNRPPAAPSISSPPPENLHRFPVQTQAFDNSKNRIPGQAPIQHAMSPESDAHSQRIRAKIETRYHLDTDAANMLTNKHGLQQPVAITAKTVISAQFAGLAAIEHPHDAEQTHELHDISALKEISLGSGQREALATGPVIPPRVDTARSIAGQLAAVISARPGAQGVDIALNPEELGRVSITFTSREDGLHMMITTERPETLDLMRRHIALLSAEFEKLGYEGLSLDLGMSNDPSQQDDHSESGGFFDTPEAVDFDAPRTPVTPIGPQRGLDVRL
ncbi:flagellar hook-length control protein FliK [uncultured Ruegeria sp.]|uniref:flagellar hook-length control protein FliK n=1 Tax=uncultured Ruegeria sp. TaxID=259304 RepID=UPI00262C2E57|nr:flagellar hook-length control protein FliK [uncultured Ruegeria sp.]